VGDARRRRYSVYGRDAGRAGRSRSAAGPPAPGQSGGSGLLRRIRWGIVGQAGTGARARMIAAPPTGNGSAVIQVDLSALSAGAKVYRARLLISGDGPSRATASRGPTRA